jgi:hypothetical protein
MDNSIAKLEITPRVIMGEVRQTEFKEPAHIAEMEAG